MRTILHSTDSHWTELDNRLTFVKTGRADLHALRRELCQNAKPRASSLTMALPLWLAGSEPASLTVTAVISDNVHNTLHYFCSLHELPSSSSLGFLSRPHLSSTGTNGTNTPTTSPRSSTRFRFLRFSSLSLSLHA